MMHPLVRALLGPWELRWEVLIPLALFGSLYALGWVRLRRQSKTQKVASKWRLVLYYLGLGSVALALMSPIDWLSTQLLTMHMVQHKILVMVSAPLIWLGNPYPVALWGLPLSVRRFVTAGIAGDTWLRAGLKAISAPGICWLVFTFTYLAWHDPFLYDLALRVDWVHNLEHLTFFLTAMLFWWPVVNGAPRLHKSMPYWGRILFVLAFVPPNAIAGFAIANSPEVIYAHYNTVPRLYGMSALQDQMIGGAVMWVWSSEMMINVAVIMLGVMSLKERKRKQKETEAAGSAQKPLSEHRIEKVEVAG
ncbi:cytochrome c oxidase assembly protein [Caldilinea sp.]|uniref:cytochrome c oxidase assembly protein n=1 Tax=Caldilinea sp. TaxID=2293560 RepID=UPI00260D8A36|nr:cytochrome c oxidase assembly protein [uncultured Caldilinea sp.]